MRTSKRQIDALRAGFEGTLLTPDRPRLDEARQVWNAMIDKRPATIADFDAATQAHGALPPTRPPIPTAMPSSS